MSFHGSSCLRFWVFLFVFDFCFLFLYAVCVRSNVPLTHPLFHYTSSSNSSGRNLGQTFSFVAMTDAARRVPISHA